MASVNAWYGYRPGKRDIRDSLFKMRVGRLPPKVDLRPNLPPIMDQGPIGSCTLQASTAALRYLFIQAKKPDVPLARLQAYYDVRALEGTIDEDAGAEIRDVIKCLFKFGAAHEDLWPYDISKFQRKPTPNVYADALQFKALVYESINPITVTAVKSALARGFPVIGGWTLYESFESDKVAQTGIVPMPKKSEQVVGGHSMLICGYGQKKGYFTVMNSWADDWGDHGFCYLPERYVAGGNLGDDYWVIRDIG